MKKGIMIFALIITICFCFSGCESSGGSEKVKNNDILANLTLNAGGEKITLPTTVGKLLDAGFEVDVNENIPDLSKDTVVKSKASQIDVVLRIKIDGNYSAISINAVNHIGKDAPFEECVVSNITLQAGLAGEELSFNGYFNCVRTLGQIKDKYGSDAISGFSKLNVKKYFNKITAKNLNLNFIPKLNSEDISMVMYYWDADF